MPIFSHSHITTYWQQEIIKICRVLYFNELLQILSECHEMWCGHSLDLIYAHLSHKRIPTPSHVRHSL